MLVKLSANKLPHHVQELGHHTWRIATKCDTQRDFLNYDPADKQTVERWETDQVGELANFFFGEDYRKSASNKKLVEKLIEGFRKYRTQPQWSHIPDATYRYLHEYFFQKVKEAREQWRLGLARVVDGGLETEEQVNERLKKQFERTQVNTVGRACRSRASFF